MKRPQELTYVILTAFFGLMTCLTACKKERAFIGIWRAEIESEPTTDIHNILFFGDMTCSWNDSILDKADSIWRIDRMGGSAVLNGSDGLHASFSKKVPVADSESSDSIVLTFAYTFHKADGDRQLYCEELDTHFKRVKRLR